MLDGGVEVIWGGYETEARSGDKGTLLSVPRRCGPSMSLSLPSSHGDPEPLGPHVPFSLCLLCLCPWCSCPKSVRRAGCLWLPQVFLTSIFLRWALAGKRHLRSILGFCLEAAHIIWAWDKYHLWTVIEFIHFIPRRGKQFLPLTFLRLRILWYAE